MPYHCLLPSALAELFVSVSETEVLTLADRYGILAALLNTTLNDDEQDALNRLLHAVQKGRFRVVDELSALG